MPDDVPQQPETMSDDVPRQPETPVATAATLPRSSYGVSELVNVPGQQDMPGQLFFNLIHPPVPRDQERARQELEKIAAVLRTVFQRKHPDLFREYFDRLLTLARGIFLPGAGFHEGALSDLAHLRSEIVQLAGGLIKSEYNANLAKAVVKAMCMILAIALLLQLVVSAFGQYQVKESVWPAFATTVKWDHSVSIVHLGFLMAASMVGLFFASMSRNLDPTFETLMTPDADLMRPWVRLLFFGIAIGVIALIFQLQLVTVAFGEAFSTARIADDLLSAILIGFLLGLGERALPSQVERWSKDLVSAASRSDRA